MGEQKQYRCGPLSFVFTPVWPGIEFGIRWQTGAFAEVVFSLGLVYVSIAKYVEEVNG